MFFEIINIYLFIQQGWIQLIKNDKNKQDEKKDWK